MRNSGRPAAARVAMTARRPSSAGSGLLAPPQTYNLPRDLAVDVWRLSCLADETRAEGASESAMMGVAWELFLELSAVEALRLMERTYARRHATSKMVRKSYSLSSSVVRRVARRMNDVKECALVKSKVRPTVWLAAESALTLLVKLRSRTRAEAFDRFGVCRKRA